MGEDDQIRVILVDDIAETRENIRKILQFTAEIEVVGVARTGREAIDIAKEEKPHVVLMDINMPDMDGIKATEAIREAVSFTQVIILSVQGDVNYMRRAMLAGARDFLTKPPMVDDLISAILRAGKMAIEEEEKEATRYHAQQSELGSGRLGKFQLTYGKVIVVYSPKGGVGCTTIATNLAVALHNEETPVVIVDCNLQFGDVSVVLNERSKNSIIDLASRANELDPDIIEEVLVTHAASGIKILAAPSRPEYAEDITGEQFRKIIQYLRKLYSYIIIDTASGLTDAVLASIDASQIIILIATQDIPAINNARLFLDLADVLEIDRRTILFTMNRVDKRIPITPEAVGENLKQEVVSVIPFDERIVVPSINRGVPFIATAKTKPVAKAILSLAETVRQRVTEMAQEEIEEVQ
ncbi:MAG: response regulator [Anaerolineales bacterium]|nr:response regulator [Anaerolineales bacterium]